LLGAGYVQRRARSCPAARPTDCAAARRRDELAAAAQGKDHWHEAWLDAPYGTAEHPVEVTSAFAERIVGVTDPDDDSLVWWGFVEEGQAPKQIIEGGEYFVLKRVAESGATHH
jgi:cytochrome c oxidase subunit 5b